MKKKQTAKKYKKMNSIDFINIKNIQHIKNNKYNTKGKNNCSKGNNNSNEFLICNLLKILINC